MEQFRFVTAWRRGDPGHVADAKTFWAATQILTPEEAQERALTLCSLAYAGEQLAGVTTIHFSAYPPLRSRFAFYRCAVAPEFRRRELAILLTRHTITTMEAWCLENGPDTIQGVATILQAQELDAKAQNPVWSEYYGNLNLAGFTDSGSQVRVAWFRHARLNPSA